MIRGAPLALCICCRVVSTLATEMTTTQAARMAQSSAGNPSSCAHLSLRLGTVQAGYSL